MSVLDKVSNLLKYRGSCELYSRLHCSIVPVGLSYADSRRRTYPHKTCSEECVEGQTFARASTNTEIYKICVVRKKNLTSKV